MQTYQELVSRIPLDIIIALPEFAEPFPPLYRFELDAPKFQAFED